MPHSEIADFFGRRRNPKLFVSCRVYDPQSFDGSELKKAVDSGVAGVMKSRSLYSLQIIVSNLGLASAKYARIVVSFENINITKVISGPNHRIDNLRGGLPTLQCDNPSGIIYADAKGGDVVWDLQVRLHKQKWGTIYWATQAEEMEPQEGNYVLLGIETAKQGDEIKPYFLPRYEDVWPDASKDSHIESDNT